MELLSELGEDPERFDVAQLRTVLVNLGFICREFGSYLSWVWALFVASALSLRRRKETQERV
jgi:hypothetical protein